MSENGTTMMQCYEGGGINPTLKCKSPGTGKMFVFSENTVTALRAAVHDYNCLLASDASEAEQPHLFHNAADKIVNAALSLLPDILN